MKRRMTRQQLSGEVPVCEKKTLLRTRRKRRVQGAKSGAGERFMLLGCMAKARMIGVFISPSPKGGSEKGDPTIKHVKAILDSLLSRLKLLKVLFL